eukprot:CAMPEP_0196579450 /NCGR_PEP_ID=MMETSP1081-20130531/22007_1 /TAXON_ID=36882 /ORGANISM="Pyramimonas amylifera, Strain CCMP720" /LENGTH=431 /DNA_ID=CAMNT_0041899053 /DNA_START=252 /DNA_END=1547 /DNA_ORIENTATION=-
MGAGGDGGLIINNSIIVAQEAAQVSVGEVPEDGTVFLVSTYTDTSVLAHAPKGEVGEGIYSLHLDSKTGQLTPLGMTFLGPNPAFVIRHPTIPNILYATTECIKSDGEIYTLEMQHDGNLKTISQQSTKGKSTCYVNIHPSEDYLVSVSYWDAKLSTFPLSKERVLGDPSQVFMQPKAEYVELNQPTREEHWTYRQRWPHSHCAVTEPYTGEYMFVTDLGLDKIFVYQMDQANGVLVCKAEVLLEKGKGPRHLVFHPTVMAAYVVNELESTVSVFRYNPRPLSGNEIPEDDSAEPTALLSHVHTISCLPLDWAGTGAVIDGTGMWKAASHASEIRMHPKGRHLYVGNRGHDSVAVFETNLEDGTLSVVEIHPSGGRCPRNFNFDRTGRFMVVGNQDTNTLNVFELDDTTGIMKEVHTVAMPSPNFIYPVPV